MDNNYDIFFATNRLTISSNPIEGIKTTISADSISSAAELCEMLKTNHCIAIITDSPKIALSKIKSLFRSVTAAGGVVTNDEGLHLMIYRNGRWDLPKGHHERGETIPECALREVEEETGVSGLSIKEKICSTSHIYCVRGRWEIKQTHWYAMHSSFSDELIPQIEEGIERVKWCSDEEIRAFLPNSFPTIQQVYYSAFGV